MHRLVIAVMLFIANPSYAGPFGFEMGMSIETLKKLTPNMRLKKPGVYVTSVVPKGSKSFEEYVLVVSPVHGLCKVGAVGVTIQTNSFGMQLSSEFTDLATALTKKYGDTDEMNQLIPGTIWRDPGDWMMALLKEERILFKVWSIEKGAQLPDNLHTIGLRARAISQSKGYIALSYEFMNFEKCVAEFEKQESDSL